MNGVPMHAFAACVGPPFRHNLLEDQGFTVVAVSRIKDATPGTTFVSNLLVLSHFLCVGEWIL
jgi:hypothetical protein